MKILQQEYLSKEAKKKGQFMILFKGRWNKDIYANEKQQRDKMVYQLRNQPAELVKQLNQFTFAPSSVVDPTRPILFE